MTLRQAQGERRGSRIKVPFYLREEVFHGLRRRAEREGVSIGEVAEEMLLRGLGG